MSLSIFMSKITRYNVKAPVVDRGKVVDHKLNIVNMSPASIIYKSTAGRYRSVSYPDGPITARYRFM